MNLVIIKYNAGNIQSVLYALERIGKSATVTDDHEQIRAADKVIFPGVGEASSAMRYLKERKLDEVIKASDGDSIIMAQKLAKQLGLAVGISSGANFLGALQLQNKLGADKVVVTVFCDSNKKYLSTDLMKGEPMRKEYLSQDVELIDYKAIDRL